ncbi:flagellar hook-basal body complex protein FliE [Aporhodopirellula aestuarii]|uniref:Flagellar hook-basal body complex protein FliE n=1 Tax=Aporhodopirellula aestuarii TaxID=2950107 RepID=A0ABT0U3B0_9BACT|nr:flagellar hook-basal body complex protein FliE [Aporhodopirellula aestuarii]MCM2371392.1 flagellar hook-basal body complex protein FliE [Aporhodopirellula aestuarii]
MSSPLRLPPIAPPPLPSFARPQAGTMPGSRRDSTSPGFSLNLSPANLSPDSTYDASSSSSGGGLTGALMDQVKGVNSMQTGADAMMNSLLTGGDVNEAEVLTAVQKADLAFRMLMQIRNKLMDAYREVQQIQI